MGSVPGRFRSPPRLYGGVGFLTVTSIPGGGSLCAKKWWDQLMSAVEWCPISNSVGAYPYLPAPLGLQSRACDPPRPAVQIVGMRSSPSLGTLRTEMRFPNTYVTFGTLRTEMQRICAPG